LAFSVSARARQLSRLSPSFIAFASGVGHPVEPLPDVRRADARSAQICGPDSISHRFQVSAYSGDPSSPSLARNLFSKDDWRAALRDEASELGPQVTLVFISASFACDGEWLAGTRSGPNRLIIRPSGKAQGVTPSTNACEEVALGESEKIARSDVRNASLVHLAISYQSFLDEFPQPRADLRVVVVVVGCHDLPT
jgi:hypothetical protein